MTLTNNEEIIELNLKQLVGNRLKKARESKSITIREAAENINKTYQWLSAIENGINYINLDDLQKLASLYMVQISQLVDRYPNQVGPLNIEERLRNFTNEIINNLPVSIPVFSHFGYLNKGEIQQPHDYIYWSRQRVAGRNLRIVQLQTNNLAPDLEANDRVVIEVGVNPTEGIGAFYLDEPRQDFNDTAGVRIVYYEVKNGACLVHLPAHEYIKEYPISSFHGQIIQGIKNMYTLNSGVGSYRNLSISPYRDKKNRDPHLEPRTK